MFEDETGFTLHPRLSRGWAKIGKRLKIPTTSQHKKRLNVFGWVAPLLGRLGMTRHVSGNREGFLACLRHLLRRLPRLTLYLYVDQASWHKGDEVTRFLKRHPRLIMDYLPRYQPALNAQERVWRRVRYETTTNRWFDDLESTWEQVQKTTRSWSRGKIKRLCQFT